MFKRILLGFLVLCLLPPLPIVASGHNTIEHWPQTEPVNALTPFVVRIYTPEPGQYELRIRGSGSAISFFRIVYEEPTNFYYAVIPGELVTTGSLQYRIEHAKGHTGWFTVQVGDALSYTDFDIDNASCDILKSALLTDPQRWFYDVGYFRPTLPGNESLSSICHYIMSPARQPGNPSVNVWVTVNCPHNTTRSITYSNPHRGLDLSILNDQPVYAVLPGKVEAVYVSGSSSYVRVKCDINADKIYDLRVKYEHVYNSQLVVDQDVYYTTLIGYVHPASPNHLHLKFETSTQLSLSQYYFFRSRPEYEMGGYVDFVKEPVGYTDGTLTVEVYGMDIGTRTHASEVLVYHRRVGQQTWNCSAMSPQFPGSDNWIINLKTQAGYSNCNVQYYIAAKRQYYTNMTAYRPCYYNIYSSGGVPVSTPPPASEAFIYYIQ